jgi:DNA-binding transcriptional LysR family regulator
VQTPALALLPVALDRLKETAPDLQVEVVQMETAPAIEALRSRAVDFVVGIEYEPVPIARHRDIDRRDLLQESALLTVHPAHPSAARADAISLSDVEHTPWAAGHRGTGLSAVIENVCNRLRGYAPDIRHRSDDGLILSALVASGRAVTLLPALLVTSMPHLVARPIREGPLQRTIFTATRAVSAEAPAVSAIRDALGHAAVEAATSRDEIQVLAV